MDPTTLQTAGMATTFTVVAGAAYKIYMAINHKQCKSKCCGKEIDVSIDIDDTTTRKENPMNSKPKEEV